MNTSTFRRFAPFCVTDGRVVLAPPETWREPETWQQKIQEKVGFWSGLSVNVLVEPDLFGEYDDLYVHHHKGNRCYREGQTWTVMDPISARCSDVLRDIFALIDRAPLLTWWLPTRHPERVRERWPAIGRNIIPDDECGIPTANPYLRRNLRLGVPADVECDGIYASEEPWDIALDLADLCGGVFVLHESGDVEVVDAD